jgi:hypothetical protein
MLARFRFARELYVIVSIRFFRGAARPDFANLFRRRVRWALPGDSGAVTRYLQTENQQRNGGVPNVPLNC